MKFREIFRFELAYQLRRAWTWLFFIAMVVFAFLMTRDGSLSEALYDDFFVNSPFAIVKNTVAGSLIWLLVAAVLAGDAAARDVATGMHPLTYTLPVSKAGYLGGRFLAAFMLNALILLAVQVGIMLAIYLPGMDASLIGPFRPAAYLTAYGFIALPNALVATAIQFALATRTGKPMASYLGSVLLFFMAFIVSTFLFFQGRRDLANLLDPIGIHFILSELSHLWTTVEKSWRLVELEGTVLKNRLLWLGIASGSLAYAYFRFRFRHYVGSNFKFRIFNFRSPKPEINRGVPAAIRDLRSEFKPTFGFAIHLRQTLVIAWASFRAIATSWAGLAMLVVIPLLTVLVIIDQMESNGVPLIPATVRVISELTDPMSAEFSRWVIVPLLIIFFAGELIWREREAGLGEITGAIPAPEWAPFVGKFTGIGLVLVVFLALLTTAGVLAQAILDYKNFEIGLYLKTLFALQLPEYLLFTLLALTVHVVVNQKYVGHLVAIIAYVFMVISPLFGVEHNLLVYGAGPGWSYTDMRGFGPFLGPWLWFKLYWAAWALLLAVAAKLLWVRGRENDLRVRLRLARQRFTRHTACTASVAAGFIFTLGGFIFYNTNVLNRYYTKSESKARQAEYERRYGRYKKIAQPQLTATTLHIEIYPERRTVDIRGTYQLVNRSTAAIDSVHVATVPNVETGDMAFDRPATRVPSAVDLGHRIYTLEKPLQPGDSVQLKFQVHVEPRGFRESGADASVVANGTFFTNGWLPSIGYQESRELVHASDRRKHGLPFRPLIASLYDTEAPQRRNSEIAFEAVVGTQEDQVAVAPGALRRTWAEGARRYFHYATDGPIGGEWAFFSANYAVYEAQWQNPDSAGQTVAIRIFHHPGHAANLYRMLRSVRASLDYYSRAFGPYRFNHISLVEHPGNGMGMHADASMIIYEEGFPLWTPHDDKTGLDLPFAIVAHEMAHQWTVPYANVEGAPVMSESVAWYYGMKVVEHARGPEQLRRLLSFMRYPHPYPPIRRGEPLLRGLDPYLSYRRGPFALYALSRYVGEQQVNEALRRLLEKHRPQDEPLATTLDLYRELKTVTPDSLQYLLHDLFEVNTYWELETEQATAKQTPAGDWQVILDVQARKIVADSAGVETDVPMDDWIEVGVFAPAKSGERNEPLYLRKHRIRSGSQTMVIHVPQQPERAGIDPNYLLIDLDADNNTRNVKIIPGNSYIP